MGYHRAGFEVVGVDIKPQPNYPFEFHQADALSYPLEGFDVIHASPPCQRYSVMTKRNGHQDEHPDLIWKVRARLRLSGKPYVIENVPGSPLIDAITLCGSSFGLPLRRHRLFESKTFLDQTYCRHSGMPRNIRIMNRGWKMTWCVPVYGGSGCKARELWPIAMGIDWMNTKEMAEAIPPAYTEFIGKQLLATILL